MRSRYIKEVLTPGMSILIRDRRGGIGSDRRENATSEVMQTQTSVAWSPKKRRQEGLLTASASLDLALQSSRSGAAIHIVFSHPNTVTQH